MKRLVPITLLTGYLGSGKTTLINHILTNKDNKKIAVIVNDIGEVNIDASLIEKGGVVTEKDDSLVALSNGCICCNLKMDLVGQIIEILKQDKFDYIVIEASGICEPLPIAQTIVAIPEMLVDSNNEDLCRLDSIVTVVDALRLKDEFNCGDSLKKEVDDEDIEKLIIEQLEFCNIIVLNKASEVSKEELAEIKVVIRSIQPKAKIIETDYSKVSIEELLDTNCFDLENTSMAAGWVEALEHHHEHEEESGEVLEYGIETFVYYRRSPMNRRMFYDWLDEDWDRSIIRTKGVVYFTDDMDTAYMVESAGNSKSLTDTGPWVCAMPINEQEYILEQNPDIKVEWDSEYKDRMNKIVIIGKNMDKEGIIAKLDSFLDL